MNKTASILISLVLVIIVIVTVYGVYSGGLDSVENALMGDDGSIADNAQNPEGSSYQSSTRTDTSTKTNRYNTGGIQNG